MRTPLRPVAPSTEAPTRKHTPDSVVLDWLRHGLGPTPTRDVPEHDIDLSFDDIVEQREPSKPPPLPARRTR